MKYLSGEGGSKIYYYDVPEGTSDVLFLSLANWNQSVNGQTNGVALSTTGKISTYSVYSRNAQSIDKNSLGLVNSSGDLYYFNTKRVFVCTN